MRPWNATQIKDWVALKLIREDVERKRRKDDTILCDLNIGGK